MQTGELQYVGRYVKNLLRLEWDGTRLILNTDWQNPFKGMTDEDTLVQFQQDLLMRPEMTPDQAEKSSQRMLKALMKSRHGGVKKFRELEMAVRAIAICSLRGRHAGGSMGGGSKERYRIGVSGADLKIFADVDDSSAMFDVFERVEPFRSLTTTANARGALNIRLKGRGYYFELNQLENAEISVVYADDTDLKRFKAASFAELSASYPDETVDWLMPLLDHVGFDGPASFEALGNAVVQRLRLRKNGISPQLESLLRRLDHESAAERNQAGEELEREFDKYVHEIEYVLNEQKGAGLPLEVKFRLKSIFAAGRQLPGYAEHTKIPGTVDYDFFSGHIPLLIRTLEASQTDQKKLVAAQIAAITGQRFSEAKKYREWWEVNHRKKLQAKSQGTLPSSLQQAAVLLKEGELQKHSAAIRDLIVLQPEGQGLSLDREWEKFGGNLTEEQLIEDHVSGHRRVGYSESEIEKIKSRLKVDHLRPPYTKAIDLAVAGFRGGHLQGGKGGWFGGIQSQGKLVRIRWSNNLLSPEVLLLYGRIVIEIEELRGPKHKVVFSDHNDGGWDLTITDGDFLLDLRQASSKEMRVAVITSKSRTVERFPDYATMATSQPEFLGGFLKPLLEHYGIVLPQPDQSAAKAGQ